MIILTGIKELVIMMLMREYVRCNLLIKTVLMVVLSLKTFLYQLIVLICNQLIVSRYYDVDIYHFIFKLIFK
jgi:hypothetical protein